MSFEVIWAHWKDDAPIYQALEVFASERIWGKPKEFGIGQAIAVSHGGNVIAALFYTNFDPDCGTIEMSCAADSPRWLTRNVLREMFEFPFIKLECQAVFVRVDADNKSPNQRDLHRIFPTYGFKRYDIPRLRGRDKTEVIYVLSEEDWRDNKFNKGKAS